MLKTVALSIAILFAWASPGFAQAATASATVTVSSGSPATASATVTVYPNNNVPLAVTTYHYDNLRTGWNQQETTLSATNFPANFGILHTVPLDEQVDAQPLLVPGMTIAGGTHDVVYVATENNTVYAIDASSGAILLQRNLGTPVPTPLGCTNNSQNGWINSTPVIDPAAKTLYVIAYVNGSPPTYQLHALNLSTLAEQPNSPRTVAASHTL